MGTWILAIIVGALVGLIVAIGLFSVLLVEPVSRWFIKRLGR